MTPAGLINVHGLTLDILGAIILAGAATDRTDRRIRLESRSYWDFSAYVLASGVKARLEGKMALTYLALGFLLQGSANVFSFPAVELSSLWTISTVGTALAAVAVWRLALALCLLPEITRVAAPLYRTLLKPDFDMALVDLDEEGYYLTCPRKPDEPDEAYWDRLKERIRQTAPTDVDDFKGSKI